MSGEFQRIRLLQSLLSTRTLPLLEVGNGDDAVVLGVEGRVVLTTDALVEGVDFASWAPWHAVGHKALAANLSDLAAMGADPVGYLLVLCLPRTFSDEDLRDLAGGMAALADQEHVTCLGGDLSRTDGPVTITITAVGQVPPGMALTRAGARAGDGIYLSGPLGGPAAGLAALLARPQTSRPHDVTALLQEYADPALRDAIRAQLMPKPRCALGRALRGVASACLDVTDGLAQDLCHLLVASNVGAELDEGALPIHPGVTALSSSRDPRALSLSGGEELELLFTSADHAAVVRAGGSEVRRIGTVTSEMRLVVGGLQLDAAGVRMLDQGVPPPGAEILRGFQHFV
ncbi:MAG: thiamine-phosphate kinase [Myxococcota bacterium]